MTCDPMSRALVLAVLLALLSGQARAGEISGSAHAIDGDTLMVGATEVRLFGIDAPELAQTCTSKKGKVKQCGALARLTLDSLVLRAQVTCESKGVGPGGTTLATCYAGPFDIAEQMLAEGWAVALPDEVPAYVRAEHFAKARNEGIWRGSFIAPAQWRRENAVE